MLCEPSLGNGNTTESSSSVYEISEHNGEEPSPRRPKMGDKNLFFKNIYLFWEIKSFSLGNCISIKERNSFQHTMYSAVRKYLDSDTISVLTL
uniref:Uncharacterized protein n=1 Tax=Anguilla anguilla TaxID=7936 RepID=A0A0E9WPJ3_ANGAN